MFKELKSESKSIDTMSKDLKEAMYLLKLAKAMLGWDAYSVEYEEQIPIGEQIDNFMKRVASDSSEGRT